MIFYIGNSFPSFQLFQFQKSQRTFALPGSGCISQPSPRWKSESWSRGATFQGTRGETSHFLSRNDGKHHPWQLGTWCLNWIYAMKLISQLPPLIADLPAIATFQYTGGYPLFRALPIRKCRKSRFRGTSWDNGPINKYLPCLGNQYWRGMVSRPQSYTRLTGFFPLPGNALTEERTLQKLCWPSAFVPCKLSGPMWFW